MDKVLVIVNLVLVFMIKSTSILLPLILKEVVDAIICSDDKEDERHTEIDS